MIPSPNHESRNGATVRLVVLHTAEGALDVASLGNYFARESVQSSSHVGIDDHRIEQYVDYSEAAWTIRSGNAVSDNAELAAFAAWSRDTWLNQHMPMIRLAAQWVRERCLARGIPIVKLTPTQVAAGQAGVIGHYDWTIGMHDGTHTDPGPGFPWSVVIRLAATDAPPAPQLRKDGVMYIRCGTDIAILVGPMFVGLASQGERQSAEDQMRLGAPVQWVERYTWDDLNRRSHALYDQMTVSVRPAA